MRKLQLPHHNTLFMAMLAIDSTHGIAFTQLVNNNFNIKRMTIILKCSKHLFVLKLNTMTKPWQVVIS